MIGLIDRSCVLDPDGDFVLFSTDEEQMEALGFVSDSILRVYVRPGGHGKISLFCFSL